MIVDRRVFVAKKGRGGDAAAVFKQIAELYTERFGDATYRIYRSNIAPFDSVAWEAEYESLADYERALAEFFALPELAPLMDKWDDVTETSGTHEIWNLVE